MLLTPESRILLLVFINIPGLFLRFGSADPRASFMRHRSFPARKKAQKSCLFWQNPCHLGVGGGLDCQQLCSSDCLFSSTYWLRS
jgi:hypothetical protein